MTSDGPSPGADVPRGTSSAAEPPLAVAALFGDRLPLARRYADLLADDGVVRGLIGPREVPRLWDRHLANCAVLSEVLPAGARVADIGSGAGLPGLVLAIARPDLEVSLVEPLLRRTTFLSEAVEDLDLPGVRVVRGRAEDLHGRERFEVVTSRAVAPLDRLLAWSMPLVEPEGAMVAMKGSSVEAEAAEAAPQLEAWGCGVPRIHVLGQDVLSVPTYALEVRWSDPVRARTSAPGPRPPSARRRRRPR